jgi:hypothetical protein
MKRILLMLIMLSAVYCAFSQEAVQAKLAKLGIKTVQVANNPSPVVLKVYKFNENNLDGGIIVFTLKDLKIDVFATVMRTQSGFVVQSIEPVNANAFNRERMGQLADSFSWWNNVNENKIPDVVSSATRHSRGIYPEIRDALTAGLKLLK